MRLLDRYLLRELIVPFFCCLGGFLIFWTAFSLFNELDDLQSHKMLLPDVAEYYLVKTPEFLVVVLPVALLLALLYTLTNHARHNEITAIRAAGVSLWRLCRPYFLAGLAASLAVLVLNEFFVPDSAEWAERIMSRHTKDPITKSERKRTTNVDFQKPSVGHRWQIGFFNYKTMELSGGVIVIWTLEDGSGRWLHAERAVYTNGCWTFYKAQEYKDPPGATAIPIPLLERDELPMRAFQETPEEMKRDIKLTARMNLGDAEETDIPIAEIVSYLWEHQGKLLRTDKNWLYTKLHGRLAAPWACLVVVLMAIPFGAASGRKNVFVGVASSVFICYANIIMLQLGLALGVSGKLPPLVAGWLPNLAFGLTGIFLALRVR